MKLYTLDASAWLRLFLHDGPVPESLGAVDIVAEPEVKLWDLAPLDIVVREAGGRFTNIEGAPGPHGGSAIATNGHLHDEVLGWLTGR